MDDAISLSVEFMPQSPETQLYAANHQFELKEFQRAVASYKLAVYYADAYALTELIQWVWRSRVRKGKPITIYLPSTRMRAFFEEWLMTSF